VSESPQQRPQNVLHRSADSDPPAKLAIKHTPEDISSKMQPTSGRNLTLEIIRSQSGRAEISRRSAPEPRPRRPAPHGIRRHSTARLTGREQPKRHKLTRGGTVRHTQTPTLNQRVRGSSPWRRTIRTQVSKPLTCVFCVRLERFLQSPNVHSGRIRARAAPETTRSRPSKIV
jgi:hypothetical protein